MFNGDYLSIYEYTGSCEYLFHEIPGRLNSILRQNYFEPGIAFRHSFLDVLQYLWQKYLISFKIVVFSFISSFSKASFKVEIGNFVKKWW